MPITGQSESEEVVLKDTVSAEAARALRHLTEIGLALSAERDIDRLLEMILTKSRELTSADAGSVFLLQNSTEAEEKGEQALYFCKAQNDSIVFQTTSTFAVSSSSLAGYAALTGQTLRFDDVYELPTDAPYRFNPALDKQTGYRTKSVLVVPMKNHRDEVIGVLQLINRKAQRGPLTWRDGTIPEDAIDDEVLPFDAQSSDLASSLASQAAVALENSRLVRTLEELFESFVLASASAIEDRDPTTSGHSQRVTKLTVALAEAINTENDGPFGEVHYSPIQLRELRYATLLHDFGKIGVRENILVKSHKIEPIHFEGVITRLQLRRAECCTRAAEAKYEALKRGASEQEFEAINAAAEAELKELDELATTLTQANNPTETWVPDEAWLQRKTLLEQIATLDYPGPEGRQPLLTEQELQALLIRKGSLTREEFEQIKQHSQLSYEFLSRISWTPEYAAIPSIAYGHHEKLNGSGYPRGVTGESILLQTRLMTVADIYDALTASDRPYKKAMPRERALQILRDEAAMGCLDSDVVELFIRHEVYRVTESDAVAIIP
jgi:HD-GYP domain-containing protein (c-di-GMP phosphodiesterase class II)